MKSLLVFLLLSGCQPRQVCFDATQCEVIIADGAIVRLPQKQAIVGAKVCLDERTAP